jgi:hypothetical protein
MGYITLLSVLRRRRSEKADLPKFARCLMYEFPHLARTSHIRQNLGAEANGVRPTHTLPCPRGQEAKRTPTGQGPTPAAAGTNATRPAPPSPGRAGAPIGRHQNEDRHHADEDRRGEDSWHRPAHGGFSRSTAPASSRRGLRPRAGMTRARSSRIHVARSAAATP